MLWLFAIVVCVVLLGMFGPLNAFLYTFFPAIVIWFFLSAAGGDRNRPSPPPGNRQDLIDYDNDNYLTRKRIRRLRRRPKK